MPDNDPVIVTYLATESEDQKRRRIALKLPAPTYSFTVEKYNGPTERKRSENQKDSERVPTGFDNAYSAGDR